MNEALQQRLAEKAERAKASWAEYEAERYGEEPDEDPLTGDVDQYVHPDETRTDDEVAYDEKFAAGGEDVDEYWADYDAYHGQTDPKK